MTVWPIPELQPLVTVLGVGVLWVLILLLFFMVMEVLVMTVELILFTVAFGFQYVVNTFKRDNQ